MEIAELKWYLSADDGPRVPDAQDSRSAQNRGPGDTGCYSREYSCISPVSAARRLAQGGVLRRPGFLASGLLGGAGEAAQGY